MADKNPILTREVAFYPSPLMITTCVYPMTDEPTPEESKITLHFCEWCGEYGWMSMYPARINGDVDIQLCTRCANAHRDKRFVYIYLSETGIERIEREDRNAQIMRLEVA